MNEVDLNEEHQLDQALLGKSFLHQSSLSRSSVEQSSSHGNHARQKSDNQRSVETVENASSAYGAHRFSTSILQIEFLTKKVPEVLIGEEDISDHFRIQDGLDEEELTAIVIGRPIEHFVHT